MKDEFNIYLEEKLLILLPGKNEKMKGVCLRKNKCCKSYKKGKACKKCPKKG